MTRPEFELIQWLRRQVVDRPPVELGIGDDAAVLRLVESGQSLVTVDMLMEGVDFLLDQTSPELVGRKSLAVSLSDIAAMGGRPVAAFVAGAFPRSRGVEFALRVHAGLLQLADEFGVSIAGGDTNTWDGPLVISTTVIGVPLVEQPIRRDGACPGDWIMVTGSCGGSLAGRHLTFTPRVREAAALLRVAPIHSMIDISDGLAADLHHLLEASGVGCTLDAASIPIHSDVCLIDPHRFRLQRALGDGEDFELLFTVTPAAGEKLLQADICGTPLHRIGTIEATPGCRLNLGVGQVEALPPLGWTHAWTATAVGTELSPEA